MFIDFSMGEESGYVRFENPDAAVKARAAAVLTDEGGLVVKNSIATLEPLSGDAEKEYWSLLRGSQERNRDSKGNYRGRGRSNRGDNTMGIGNQVMVGEIKHRNRVPATEFLLLKLSPEDCDTEPSGLLSVAVNSEIP
ncbi:la protein 1-like [Iris pallida]|uniref:La protein 1-like n=1 Tax=Iris pallida TaxID=29817 RepID=A0AAX6G9E4_IRIPA|nr:la protein 1-like [Iris pallida]